MALSTIGTDRFQLQPLSRVLSEVDRPEVTAGCGSDYFESGSALPLLTPIRCSPTDAVRRWYAADTLAELRKKAAQAMLRAQNHYRDGEAQLQKGQFSLAKSTFTSAQSAYQDAIALYEQLLAHPGLSQGELRRMGKK